MLHNETFDLRCQSQFENQRASLVRRLSPCLCGFVRYLVLKTKTGSASTNDTRETPMRVVVRRSRRGCIDFSSERGIKSPRWKRRMALRFSYVL